jgi:diaminopimelate decarboxylase
MKILQLRSSSIAPNTEMKELISVVNYLIQFSQCFLLSNDEVSEKLQTGDDKMLFELLQPFLSVQSSVSDPIIIEKICLHLFSRFSVVSTQTKTIIRRAVECLLLYMKLPEILLSVGGDDRLSLMTGQSSEQSLPRNKYLSSTLPEKQESVLIRRGSCTCSTVVSSSYSLTERLIEQFFQQTLEICLSDEVEISLGLSSYYEEINRVITTRLMKVLGLSSPSSSSLSRSSTGTVSPSSSNDQPILSAQCVLFPSGSDAEYLPLIVALIRSFNLGSSKLKGSSCPSSESSSSSVLSCVKVYNYVTAWGEVGSGTANASNGQYFSASTPRGGKLSSSAFDSYLQGFHSEMIETIHFKPRGVTGRIDLFENQLISDIKKKLSTSETSVVLLHVVCGSKTGLISPSLATLSSVFSSLSSGLAAKERIIVVIDACQLRCRLELVSEYINRNYPLLVTGSKFFTGPPFSGAVILPSEYANDIEVYLATRRASGAKEECLIPEGIIDFITQYEVSAEMKELKQYLRDINIKSLSSSSSSSPSSSSSCSIGWFNYGLSLRWSLSLDIMERYSALPSSLIQETTVHWIRTAKTFLSRYSPFIRLLDDETEQIGIVEETPGNMNSIISFSLYTFDNVGGGDDDAGVETRMILRELSADEYKEFCRLMSLAAVLSSNSSASFAASSCSIFPAGLMKIMLGQPVKLGTSKHVIRIALGADMILSMLEQPLKNVSVFANEERSISWIREAFSSVCSTFLHAPSGVSSFPGQEGTRSNYDYDLFKEENPFYSSIHRVLEDDFKSVDKSFQLLFFWNSRFTFKILNDIELKEIIQNPKKSSYVEDKKSKFFRLDQQLYYPLSSRDISSASASASAVINMKHVQQCLQQYSSLSQENPSFVAKNSMILYDLDAVSASFTSVNTSFQLVEPNILSFLHCFAVKSCPVSYLLHLAISQGNLGCECASLTEVKQSLSSGCLPEKIVYDSPCKTYEELVFALKKGVRINCNSFHDLDKITSILNDLSQQGIKSISEIGIRINPLIGSGTIAALSTATNESKFGIPLFSSSSFPVCPSYGQKKASETGTVDQQEPEETNEDEYIQSKLLELYESKEDTNFNKVIDIYSKYSSFLTGMMCHVGSQGMSLDLMIDGVYRLYHVIIFLHRQILKKNTITWFDIGGGLSCNYHYNEISPTFTEYYQGIKGKCPLLFSSGGDSPFCVTSSASASASAVASGLARQSFLIVTEFGKSLIAKTAVIVSQIEDIIEHPTSLTSTSTQDEHEAPKQKESVVSCIIHAGADLVLRNAYCPEKFSNHSFLLFDKDYSLVTPPPPPSPNSAFSGSITPYGLTVKSFYSLASNCRESSSVVNIVGPLCFSGDTLATHLLLPTPQLGDSMIMLDCGANTLSLFSRHCSRLSPVVIGFRSIEYCEGESEKQKDIIWRVLREEETSENVMKFWD